MHGVLNGYIPVNMAKCTAWDVKVFKEWRKKRNENNRERRHNRVFSYRFGVVQEH